MMCRKKIVPQRRAAIIFMRNRSQQTTHLNSHLQNGCVSWNLTASGKSQTLCQHFEVEKLQLGLSLPKHVKMWLKSAKFWLAGQKLHFSEAPISL